VLHARPVIVIILVVHVFAQQLFQVIQLKLKLKLELELQSAWIFLHELISW